MNPNSVPARCSELVRSGRLVVSDRVIDGSAVLVPGDGTPRPAPSRRSADPEDLVRELMLAGEDAIEKLSFLFGFGTKEAQQRLNAACLSAHEWLEARKR